MKLRLSNISYFRRAILLAGLNKLHAVLSESPLHKKYCIVFGALLGWAREGALLKHDDDVDFLFWQEDRDALEVAIDMLLVNGFQYERCWRNTKNEVTEHILTYRGLRFEFFGAHRVNGKAQFYAFGKYHRGGQYFELLYEVTDFELTKFDFLGKTWLKPADHEKFLAEMYGDWKTPNKDFDDIREGPGIISRTPIASRSIYRPKQEL